MGQVQNEVSLFPLGEGVAVDAGTLGGRELYADAVVGKSDFVIAWRGLFGVVAVARAVAFVGRGGASRGELQRAGGRHQQDIAQIGMSRTTQVGMAETDDSRVTVSIAGAVFVGFALVASAHVVGDGVGIGAELHQSEGGAGTGEGVPHAVGTDDWVHVVGRLLGRGGERGGEQGEEESYLHRDMRLLLLFLLLP